MGAWLQGRVWAGQWEEPALVGLVKGKGVGLEVRCGWAGWMGYRRVWAGCELWTWHGRGGSSRPGARDECQVLNCEVEEQCQAPGEAKERERGRALSRSTWDRKEELRGLGPPARNKAGWCNSPAHLARRPPRPQIKPSCPAAKSSSTVWPESPAPPPSPSHTS